MIRRPSSSLYVLAAAATMLVAIPGAFAQAPPAHTHYAKPPGYDQAAAPGQPLAPRLQNLGVHVFPVTTKVSRAQLFINQGLNLAYGFNHAEAGRAFAEAARLDPQCAMAYWGQALVLGPNINATMNAEDEPKAKALADKAVALKTRASARERAYIDAIAVRYTGRAEDRATGGPGLCRRDAQGHGAFPRDLDAKTIFAESLMDLRPWNYWTRDGEPYPETREISSSLQQVIAANRNHPGALHYWVHLWESTHPERAEAEADRLLPLMPGAGHIVHMPAHIYMRSAASPMSSRRTRKPSRPTKTTSRSARRRASIRLATTHTTFTSSGWARARRAAVIWPSSPRARSRRSSPRMR